MSASSSVRKGVTPGRCGWSQWLSAWKLSCESVWTFRADLRTAPVLINAELSTANPPRAGRVPRTDGVLTEPLFLGLEQALVLLDELFNLPSHTKDLPPLLFVQR